MTRVALIGLDSANVDYAFDLVARGRLPTLARLLASGTRFDVRSPEPIGWVWESFLNGRPSLEDQWVFDPATYDTSYLDARDTPHFFVTDPSLKVVALDAPFMSLRHAVPGAQVTAWGGHNPNYPRASHPMGLLQEIDERFGLHPAFARDRAEWHHAPSFEALSAALQVGAARRAEIARWMLGQVPDWELFLAVFSETHSAGECMWQSVDPSHPLATFPTTAVAGECLEAAYVAVDAAVGEVLDALPPDVVTIVCSLHGTCADGLDLPTNVLLPELLYRLEIGRPYLASSGDRRWKRAGCPPVVPTEPTWIAHMRRAEVDARRTGLRRLRRARYPEPWDIGPPPPETHESPEAIGRPVKRADADVPAWYRPHWPAMRAFAVPSVYVGRIRLNVQGRERDGLVAASDYSAVRDEIEAEVRACRDPRTGAGVVHHIARAADDPFALPNDGADLRVYWSGKPDAFEHPRLGIIGPYPYLRTGAHRPEGFAVVTGPGIAPGDEGEIDMLDLAPTILELLGRRAPSWVEGTPITIPASHL